MAERFTVVLWDKEEDQGYDIILSAKTVNDVDKTCLQYLYEYHLKQGAFTKGDIDELEALNTEIIAIYIGDHPNLANGYATRLVIPDLWEPAEDTPTE